MGMDISGHGDFSDAPIFKFANVGDTIEGTITGLVEQPVPESFVDGKPVGQKLSRKGKPLTQWQITIDTKDGERRFYTKWRMFAAIADAARRVGVDTVDEGGKLRVKRVADVKGGGSVPAHAFEADYVAPTETAAAAFQSAGLTENTSPPF